MTLKPRATPTDSTSLAGYSGQFIVDAVEGGAEHAFDVYASNPISGRKVRFSIENNQDTAPVDITFHNATVTVGHYQSAVSASTVMVFQQPAGETGNMIQVYQPGSQTRKVFYVDPNGGLHLPVGGLASTAFTVYVDGEANDRYRISEYGQVTLGPGGATAMGWGRFHGTGSPEGVLAASPGSTYQRRDGGASTSFYVKESGTAETGWVAK